MDVGHFFLSRVDNFLALAWKLSVPRYFVLGCEIFGESFALQNLSMARRERDMM